MNSLNIRNPSCPQIKKAEIKTDKINVVEINHKIDIRKGKSLMNIVLIDDDQLVCMSLKMILEASGDIHVSAIGHDGSDALPLYQQYRPDILLMDIRMQHRNGTDALSDVLEQFPDARVLFLTTFVDDEYITKALQLGAKGYIIKQDYETIIPALNAVYSGQNVYGSEIMEKLPGLMQQEASFNYSAHDISQKEYEIITLVAQGLSNKEIAAQLFLSEGTIRNYLSGILEKLQLRDRTQLAVFFYQHS
jgi:DNA-binding NarL/FixJ family response regulator